MYFRTETYMYIVEMLILPKCSVFTCILVTSQFAYLELQITQSSFSIPLDFDIWRLHCIKVPVTADDFNFFYFSEKIRLDMSCNCLLGKHSHEMSSLCALKKKKKKKKIEVSSAAVVTGTLRVI